VGSAAVVALLVTVSLDAALEPDAVPSSYCCAVARQEGLPGTNLRVVLRELDKGFESLRILGQHSSVR
jgi:hypothetical protein